MLSKLGKSLALLLLVVMTIGCDRVTKQLATENLAGAPTRSFLADTFRLAYAENLGGFLSRGSMWHAAAFALFIPGGASNWFDRLSDGRVVDFMNVGVGWLRTGIFNVADVAIMLGLAVFVFAELRLRSGSTST